MLCIFCREEKTPTDEHIFPLAIGGSLVTTRVCNDCNSRLGAGADARLSNWLPVLAHRERLNLKGNSGSIPSPLRMLTGKQTLIERDGSRHDVVGILGRNRALTHQVIPSCNVVLDDDGNEVLQISADPRDVGYIEKSIRRARSERGLRELTPDEMREALESIETYQGERSLFQLKVPAADLWPPRHALGKIAYELAHLWLGESYLEDPTSKALARAVLDDRSHEIDDFVRVAVGRDKNSFWRKSPDRHLAHASRVEEKLVVYVRIFDLIDAVVIVSETADLHGGYPSETAQEGFLVIDASSKTVLRSSWDIEVLRLAALMMKGGTMGDLPDPLSDQAEQ